jgi:hypothetical protein
VDVGEIRIEEVEEIRIEEVPWEEEVVAFMIIEEEEMARKDNSNAMILEAGVEENLGVMQVMIKMITNALV